MQTEGSSTLEAKSDHLTPLPTAMKVEGLSKKQDSLLGLQRLLIATCETQQEMAGVKECFGESWFRPQWERFVSVCYMFIRRSVCMRATMFGYSSVNAEYLPTKLMMYTYLQVEISKNAVCSTIYLRI